MEKINEFDHPLREDCLVEIVSGEGSPLKVMDDAYKLFEERDGYVASMHEVMEIMCQLPSQMSLHTKPILTSTEEIYLPKGCFCLDSPTVVISHTLGVLNPVYWQYAFRDLRGVFTNNGAVSLEGRANLIERVLKMVKAEETERKQQYIFDYSEVRHAPNHLRIPKARDNVFFRARLGSQENVEQFISLLEKESWLKKEAWELVGNWNCFGHEGHDKEKPHARFLVYCTEPYRGVAGDRAMNNSDGHYSVFLIYP